MSTLLRVAGLGFTREQAILKDISFEVRAGEILLILGPSGAGKSTLLRCINRLDPFDRGEVYLDGREVRTLDVLELRRRVGMVFQVPALIPFSVKANILLGPSLRKQRVSDAECRSLLQQVGLSEAYLHRQVETLSVGEQQRVAFAQVLANRPEVLLLDEPTSALDPTAVLTIENLIKHVHQEYHPATVMVTHDLAQALRFNTRTLILYHGEVLAQGYIQDLMQSTDNPTLQKFFKGELGDDASSPKQE